MQRRASHGLVGNIGAVLLCDLGRIVVHDDGHGVDIETVALGCETLTEAVGDVVGAEKTSEDDENVSGHESEGNSVPCAKNSTLELHVPVLASVLVGTGVAERGNSRFVLGRKVTTALERVLDTKTANCAEITRPLEVDLAFKVEGLFLVCNVAGGDDECKADPEQKSVDGQEGTVVEKNTRVAEQ